jgi:ssDNA-binding Zn-finger/Zn-ribbon topoisomerase 1
MGCVVKAECLDCGKNFEMYQGPSALAHLVRCDKCGKTKFIGFKDLGELRLRYLKGLSEPYSIWAIFKAKKHISKEEYYRGVSAFAGRCECGGNYTLDAPQRCPKCHSTRIRRVTATMIYD